MKLELHPNCWTQKVASPFNWSIFKYLKGLTGIGFLKREYIQEKKNLILYGGVGTGKTYLETLISLNAIHRYDTKVKFFILASLANKLIEANQNGSLPRLIKQLERLELLILDKLDENKSLVITTNLQFGQWNHVFGDPILTEAVD
jgi:DNA replication protein DnaC